MAARWCPIRSFRLQGERMSLEKKSVADPSPRIPVARPALKTPKIRDSAEPEPADLVEDLLSPPSIRGFAWSIGGHAIFLLILAFWYFAPPVKPAVIFDTRLAGSEFGDPSSDQLTGGLGMDTPLALPEAPDAPALSDSKLIAITSLPASEIQPAISASVKPKSASGAANGGGVNLTNPGQGGNGDGFGVAKFGNGGETINGVDVKIGDPQFTLIWDTLADIDLHVVEPGGDHISFMNKAGEGGGELDVDNTKGFGPENINYGQNRGAPGTYRWFVHYYAGPHGQVPKTRWKVRIKYNGKITLKEGILKSIDQSSETLTLKVGSGGSSTPPPASESMTETKAAPEPSSRPTAATPSPTIVTGPRKFAPANAGFSVTFDEEPKASRKDLTTPLGLYVADSYSIEKTEGAWNLDVVEFPSASIDKIDPSKLLDGMVDQVVADHKGTTTRKVQVAQQGSAGREFEFSLPDSVVAGGGGGRARVFLRGKRIFILSLIGTKKFVAATEADAPFKSLEFSGPR